MNLRPIGPQILVRALKVAEPKPGEFFIPNADAGPMRAQIVALGTGPRDERGNLRPFEVTVDDIVLVNRYAAASELKHEGDKYYLLKEDDLLGVVPAQSS